MGLDGVELLMATEEEFGISVPDHDAWGIETPRQLADYVARRLGEHVQLNEPHCRSQAHFYWLRANLVEQLGLKRSAIRPDTPLSEILRGDLREHWKTLRQAGAFCSLPRLRAPARFSNLVFLAPLMMGVFAFLMKWPGELMAILALCAWVLAEKLNRHFARLMPDSLKTVRDLLPYVGVPQRQFKQFDEILQKVMLITSEQLGIPLETIHPDHHFIKDLGMDQ